jgi:hypothetical protein
LLKTGGNYTGCKSECKESGIGKNIAQVAGDSIQCIQTFKNPLEPVAGFSSAGQDNSDGGDDHQYGSNLPGSWRKYEAYAQHRGDHGNGQQVNDRSADEHVPEYDIIDGIQNPVLTDTALQLQPQTGKKMDQTQQNEKVSILIGRLIGSNQIGGREISVRPKNVVAITFVASPKKLPNIKPQNMVPIPQSMNI